MNIDLWTFRSPALHHLRSLALAAVVLALAACWRRRRCSLSRRMDASCGPTTVHRPLRQLVPSSAKATIMHRSTIGAMSRQRWKPVRPASPSAMRSARPLPARSPATLSRAPSWIREARAVKGELAAKDPNYSRAAGNRSVSAAEIDHYINEAAARHHVDPNLVRALVKVESNFNPHAVSRKGAMGLMQLMPATARMYDVRNPFDAAQNVDAGVRHLKGLAGKFSGDVPLSLAAYNAGQGAVERNGGIPPYTETRNYVKRITNLMGSSSDAALQQLVHPHSRPPR